MTLSIMEGHDVFKAALRDYKGVVGDIPKVLERYLGYVARTGKPLFTWDMIVALIIKKFEIICEEYITDETVSKIRISVEERSVEELKMECLKILNDLTGVPFTIQRICELLLSPRQNYSRLDKFLRGFLRVIKVVTTVNRVGQRITTESQSFANALSPFPMNQIGDKCPALSDECSNIIHEDSPTSNSICSTETKGDMDYEDKSCDDTLNRSSDTLSSYVNNNNNNRQQQNIYSDTFFIDQKTISMPPIGALFKPIDQLEAFVQNVSSQVESSIDVVAKDVSSKKKRSADDSINSEDNTEVGVSCAKKQKVNETVLQVANSSNVNRSSESIESIVSVVPSRSSDVLVCAEEASSTNDLIDDGSTAADDDIKIIDCLNDVTADFVNVAENSVGLLCEPNETFKDVIDDFGNGIIKERSDGNEIVCNSSEIIVKRYDPEVMSLKLRDITVVNVVDNLYENDDKNVVVDCGDVDDKLDSVIGDCAVSESLEVKVSDIRSLSEIIEVDILNTLNESLHELSHDSQCLVDDNVRSFEKMNSSDDFQAAQSIDDQQLENDGGSIE